MLSLKNLVLKTRHTPPYVCCHLEEFFIFGDASENPIFPKTTFPPTTPPTSDAKWVRKTTPGKRTTRITSGFEPSATSQKKTPHALMHSAPSITAQDTVVSQVAKGLACACATSLTRNTLHGFFCLFEGARFVVCAREFKSEWGKMRLGLVATPSDGVGDYSFLLCWSTRQQRGARQNAARIVVANSEAAGWSRSIS
jgi:hypothetical protein